MASIHLETTIHAPIERVFDLARDIDFHQRSMTTSHERAIAGRITGLIGLGETVTWRARHLGRTWTLTSEITVFEPPSLFVDEQVSGPFAGFRHEHRFETVACGTRMIDDWKHSPPFGMIGRIADALVIRRLLRRLLVARNAALVLEAERRGVERYDAR